MSNKMLSVTVGILLCLSATSATDICKLSLNSLCASARIAKKCGVYDKCVKPLNLPARRAAPPVNVTLYYESMCDRCNEFIRVQLYPTWQHLGPDVINVSLVPYGKADESLGPDGRWRFDCEHYLDECIGNYVQTCALHLLPTNESLALISCIGNTTGLPAKATQPCAEKLGITIDKVMDCSGSELGNQLEHQMALRTDALKPPLTFVPWITVNGVFNVKQENIALYNLLDLVCRLYQGPTPSACRRNIA